MFVHVAKFPPPTFTTSFLFPCYPQEMLSSVTTHILSSDLPAKLQQATMLLRGSPSTTTAFSLSTPVVEHLNRFPSPSSVGFLSQRRRRSDNGFFVSKNESNNPSSPGVVFEPFEHLQLVPQLTQQSLARHKFSNDCEAAVNYHINWEYNVSYVFHALYAYYDRDNIALRGFAKFFKEASLEERKHAELLMEYQNTRGGKVELEKMLMPEFYPPEIGEASYAMELALSIAKITNNKLLQLHNVADENDDAQLADFIESTFLTEQEEAIKKISKFVSLLRRIGEGHGVWHFDRMLLNA